MLPIALPAQAQDSKSVDNIYRPHQSSLLFQKDGDKTSCVSVSYMSFTPDESETTGGFQLNYIKTGYLPNPTFFMECGAKLSVVPIEGLFAATIPIGFGFNLLGALDTPVAIKNHVRFSSGLSTTSFNSVMLAIMPEVGISIELSKVFALSAFYYYSLIAPFAEYRYYGSTTGFSLGAGYFF